MAITIEAYGAAASKTTSAQVLDCFSRCNAGALLDLLPHGAMWPRDLDTDLWKLVSAFAIELGRVDCQIETMLAESYPDTAQQTLTHWEDIAGLPDACDGVVDSTIAGRQQGVVDVFAQDNALDPVFWAAYWLALGYAYPTITKNSAFCTGVSCTGDALCPLEAVFTITLTFATGADDALLECKTRKLWPDYAPLIIIFV